MAVEKVKLVIEFDMGTAEELGIGQLKQQWISSEHEGRQYDLMCGAGVGNPLIDVSARIPGEKAIYARADISEMTANLWDVMTQRLFRDGQ